MDPVAEEKIRSNIDRIRGRIDAAALRAGRNPGDVRIVAVVKSVGVEETRFLAGLGLGDLGENRVEAAFEKVKAVANGICWHMVGGVQRRKVRDVVELFDRVDSVDRISLAETLENRCAEAGKRMPVLVQVNVSGETSKHGFDVDEVGEAVAKIREMRHLEIQGLMTMAPEADDAEELRPVFARLRGVAQDLGLRELSMGMSNDYEVAVEEGATEVRIGRALFI